MSTVTKKFDQLPAATTPLGGTELFAAVQGVESRKVTLDQMSEKIRDGLVTLTTAQTLTNKTIEDYTNNVAATSTHFRVKAGATLVKGDVVKASGYTPGEAAIQVVKVSSDSDVALGIMEQSLTSGQFGTAIVIGELFDVNTNGFNAGDALYSNGAGGVTTSKPASGVFQSIGWVVRAATNNGVIAVNIVNQQQVEATTNTAGTIAVRSTNGDVFVGAVYSKPVGTQTPATNGELVFELTNNTTITVKAKGSDGVVRSATLTLAP